MSRLGILASGLAGGFQAINQQATGDIEKKTRLDIAAEMSKIQEQASMRLAERQAALTRQGNKDALVDTRDFQSSDETIAARGKVADADSATQRRGLLAIATDEQLNAAQREKAAGDAKALHDSQVSQTIADAGNAPLLAATSKLKLADPEIAQRIAASRAAANASNEHSGMIAAQTAGVKLDVKDKEKLNGLYDQASTILSNPELTDEIRAKQISDVQRQITLMKSKNGAGAARDPELDIVTTKTKTMNPDGSETETTEKSVRRPGAPSEQKAPYPDGTELKGKDGQIYVVKDGQPVPKGPASTKASAPAVTSGTGLLSTVPAAEPSKAAYDAEIAEMSEGKRLKFSPAAEAYSRSLNAESKARDRQASEEARAKELQRALKGGY